MSKQAFFGSVAGLSSVAPELTVLEVPYLFESFSEADKALDDSAVQKQVRKILAQRKLIFGHWAENGFRSYFSRHPIHGPNDMQGLRFRSWEGRSARLVLRPTPFVCDLSRALRCFSKALRILEPRETLCRRQLQPRKALLRFVSLPTVVTRLGHWSPG